MGLEQPKFSCIVRDCKEVEKEKGGHKQSLVNSSAVWVAEGPENSTKEEIPIFLKEYYLSELPIKKQAGGSCHSLIDSILL